MTKSKERTSAAIIGLLDAIKSEGIKPIDHEFLNKETLPHEKNIQTNNNRLTLTSSPEDSPRFTIIEIDPDKVTPWHMANRLEAYITQDSCAELIESVKSVGQQIPALIRKTDVKDHYELICGARRLFTCKTLGRKLLAAVVNLSDKEALLAMDAENRPRNDISPYERALDYKNWIEKGIYKNQTDICNTIGMKKSLFTQVFSLSDIDQTVVQLFGHPNNLNIKWGYQLSKACKDPDKKKLLLQKAGEIKKLSLKPKAIYTSLLSTLKESDYKPNSLPTIAYVNKEKNIQMEIQQGKKSFAIKINNIANHKALDKIITLLAKELDLVEKS